MKPFLMQLSKRYPFLRLARHYYVILRNHVLWIKQLRHPIQQKTVIFQAYDGKYTCSPKALYEYMLHDERFEEFRFIWAVSDEKKYAYLTHNPRTRLVTTRTRAYYTAFATSKYWIVNSMLPLRVVKRAGQVMVQCWHGTPLKRLRNDIIESTKNAMNSHQDFIRKNKLDTLRYDYFVSPSSFATEKFISAFGLERLQEKGHILEIGYPRNDMLLTTPFHESNKIKQKLQLPINKKILLYAPTWRDDQHNSRIGYTYKNELDFHSLRQELGEEYVVLFRAHYMIAQQFDFSAHRGFVYDVSTYDDINELYIVSDALITDYSSAMFDYANLQKPIIFFMYDQTHYEQQLRGFYITIDELPGEIVKTQKQLVTCLRHLDEYEAFYQELYAAFCRRYVQLDDGRASSRLINAIFDPPPLAVHSMYLSLRRYQPLIQQGRD